MKIYMMGRKKGTKKELKRKRVENWLKTHSPYLRKLPIEKKLSFPKEGIQRFLREKEKRKLTDEEIDKLDAFIQEMFFSYEDDKID